jgi:NAD(P)-dependent dehydrogenase (short-subunit alcohol dehydrogenase family)
LQYKTERKADAGQVRDPVNPAASEKRVVIVTGAGRGLGRAYALDLAARGQRVVVNNRRRQVDDLGLGSAQHVVREIREAGGEAVASEDDVCDPASGTRLVQCALETWGRLDALVANAGVDQHKAFHRIGLDEFLEIFDVNFLGTLRVTHAAYTHMRERGHGRIVVSSSSAGLHGLHGLSAYAASKAALIGLMRSLAGEGRSRDVLCNAVAPYAATRMTEKHAHTRLLAAMRPEHVAPLVALLVSERCPISGQIVVAGGGYFRRAAMVEGPGIAYADPAGVTPAALELDLGRLLSLEGAREFADALLAFDDFSRATAQGQR